MAHFFQKQPSSRQGTVQNITLGAASAQLGTKFGSETFQIRLSATSACYYVVSENANPVAATIANGSYLPANVIEFVTVSPGQTLTAIEASAAGTLNVTEMS